MEGGGRSGGKGILKGLVSRMENSPEGGGAMKRGMVDGWVVGLGRIGGKGLLFEDGRGFGDGSAICRR